MRLAYLVNQYPMGSQSFIRREIRALERRGVAVQRHALRGNRAALKDAGDLEEHDRTRHLLAAPARLIGDAAVMMLSRPGPALAALGRCLRAGRQSDRGHVLELVCLAEALALARRLRQGGVTHLHAHFGTNSATVAMLAAGITGIPYSFTVHGPEEFDRAHGLALGEKIGRAAFVVAVSSFGRSQLCRWCDLGHWEKLKIVHCGIDPDRFPDPGVWADPGPRLVCVGRLDEQKGHLLLLDAFRGVVAVNPAAHLTFVGDGSLRARIEAQVAAWGLGANVAITGWVDEARVRAELAAARGFVLPSFAEGLPVALMEAMAAGRPVISTYVAGIPELVIPGESGWLVPAGDVPALTGAITALLEAPFERVAAMGAAARGRALARHDVDVEAGKLAAHFAAAAGV